MIYTALPPPKGTSGAVCAIGEDNGKRTAQSALGEGFKLI